MISFPSVRRTLNILLFNLFFYLSSYLLFFLLSCIHIYLPQPTHNFSLLLFQTSCIICNHRNCEKPFLRRTSRLTEKLSCKAISTILLSRIFPVLLFSNSLLYKYRHTTTKLLCACRALHVFFIEQRSEYIHIYIYIYRYNMVFLQLYIVSVGVTLLKLILDNLVPYTIDPSRLYIKSL